MSNSMPIDSNGLKLKNNMKGVKTWKMGLKK